ncbi:hypothetical protein K488DRAFT_73854 [Vararia minispora EC-137]|uniref:Uncharacterized protein n=1 Tax=Vararia minispora EC-137 TaxID=1314806 RepID=A0ACB8Q9C4_9AGAM|nr:hypothetical protein K488DRAFT_73854 [Vararia minispora EC-137]
MHLTSIVALALFTTLSLVAPSQGAPVSASSTTTATASSSSSALLPVNFTPLENGPEPAVASAASSAPAPASTETPNPLAPVRPVSFIPSNSEGTPILPRSGSAETAEARRRELEGLLTRLIHEKRVTENELIGLMLFSRSLDTDS